MRAAVAASVLLFGAAFASTAALAQTSQVRAIEAAKSKAQFAVQPVFVERVTGTVPILSGSVTLPAHGTIPESVTAVLDASKLDTGDSDRDGDLRSPDFFEVKRFPKWTFASTAVTRHSATSFGLDGDLTIHGVSHPEHLEVTVAGDATHPTYRATAQVDRRDFKMAVTRLDSAIGETVDLTLSIVLAEPAPPAAGTTP
jgi:polyisoprenoid-binding protein YceI